MTLKDKVVVITGAGSGIGRGLVAGFCGDGAHVVGIGRTEATLEATAEQHGHGRMHYVVGDISSGPDVERLFAEAEARHGRVDVLINNAAIYPKRYFLDSPIEEWERTFDINVNGMARCCHRALPGMLDRGHGRIINVGSYAWNSPIPKACAYSASKAAVKVLTKCIALEIDRYHYPDVLVNEWNTPICRTGMTPESDRDPLSVYGEGARMIASFPIGGPHGVSFIGNEPVWEESAQGSGFKSRLKRKLKRMLGR